MQNLRGSKTFDEVIFRVFLPPSSHQMLSGKKLGTHFCRFFASDAEISHGSAGRASDSSLCGHKFASRLVVTYGNVGAVSLQLSSYPHGWSWHGSIIININDKLTYNTISI